jgi:ectoine hydroxylase-related dioxygenase (phytanoyl-CoA dioxygenase family)
MTVTERRQELTGQELERRLDQLDRDGFLLIEGAMSPEETERIRQRINFAREQGWQEGLNPVGNMWFDTLLERDPETFRPLVAHSSVRPILEALMGPQCQLRSLRGHINPGPYLQEWHMDFYGYWSQPQRRLTQRGVGVNTTFYFQDNGPELAYLKFVKGGHLSEPPGLDRSLFHGYEVNEFRAWCDAQEHVIVYPKAGDCILFYSHIPHQGAKLQENLERSNVVCHYQCTPMYEGIWHVSRPIGYQGTFPLAG